MSGGRQLIRAAEPAEEGQVARVHVGVADERAECHSSAAPATAFARRDHRRRGGGPAGPGAATSPTNSASRARRRTRRGGRAGRCGRSAALPEALGPKSKTSVSMPSTASARCSASRRSRQRSLMGLSSAVNLTEHMAALGVGAELAARPGRRAGKLRRRRRGQGPGNRRPGRPAPGRHGDEAVARALADQQIADGVMAMGEQRPDDVGVAPMLRVGRQAEVGSVRRGVGRPR